MKRIILNIGFILIGVTSLAQQDALYTQYMENQIYVNPAYAGSKEYLQLTALHRQQWVGFAGAPISTSLSIHSPLKYKSVGIGLDVLNDKVGPVNRLSTTADFSYRIHFKNDRKLSFGIKAGFDSYSTSFQAIDASGDDPLIQNMGSVLSPTFGLGMYYFAPKWFAGASIPRITENLSGKVGGLDDARHIFAIAGCVLPLGNDWKLRPSSQFRYAKGAPISLDINLGTVYADKLWLGAMYRMGNGVGAYVQYQISPQFKFGYAYDFTVNGIRATNKGSHELMISYGIIKVHKGLVSPRYF